MRAYFVIAIAVGCAATSSPPVTENVSTQTSIVVPVRTVRASSSSTRDDGTIYALPSTDDPYLAQLVVELRQSLRVPPSEALAAEPVACVHLSAAGTIARSKLEVSSGDAALDASVQQGLETLQYFRNEHPVPVPDRLRVSSMRWVCFRVALD